MKIQIKAESVKVYLLSKASEPWCRDEDITEDQLKEHNDLYLKFLESQKNIKKIYLKDPK